MAESETKKVPPYVPWRTFENYLDSLKSFGPTLVNVIDRDSMRTLSGASQTQLLHALRYLALIDKDGAPKPRLAKIVHGSVEERRGFYQQLIVDEYPFLDGINLRGATPKQVDEAFATTGATGDTIRKCVAFFVGMAKAAHLPLSTLVTKKARRPRGSNGSARPKKRQVTRPRGVASMNPDDMVDADDEQDSAESMKTIQLPTAGGYLKLTGNFNLFDLAGDERDLVFTLIDKMREFEARHPAEGGPDD